jgi:hypothetical protein
MRKIMNHKHLFRISTVLTAVGLIASLLAGQSIAEQGPTPAHPVLMDKGSSKMGTKPTRSSPKVSRSDSLSLRLLALQQQTQGFRERSKVSYDSVLQENEKKRLFLDAQKERQKRQELLLLARKLKSRDQIDALSGLSERDRAYLHRRYTILHPMQQ